MAVLLTPGAGLIPEQKPVTQHNEYPKHMTHPAFRPGTVGKEVMSPNKVPYNLPGEAIRFPPVLVMDADQEEYHAAQGYVSVGKSDPQAFARAVASATPPPTDHNPVEYPKWVKGKIVNSAEEEAALSGPPALNAEGAEPESFEATMEAVDRALNEKTPAQIEIEALKQQNAKQAAELAEMRAMMEAATAPSGDAAEPADAPALSHGDKVRLGRERARAARGAEEEAA